MKYTIAIIGGGASGMMAAITASKNGALVTVFESKDRLGKKILSTGNGKCNFTNLVQSENCYRSRNQNFSTVVRNLFSVEDTLMFFQSIGIEPKIKDGYVYPNSEQAASVADALSMELRSRKVQVIHEQVVSVKKRNDKFLIKTEKDKKEFDRVILCCGSPAGMKNPEEFNGYRLAEQLKHHIVPFVPALVQMHCKEKWFKTISGVRTQGRISLLENGVEVATEQGELLFTDYGLSGIPVFQISRFAGYALLRDSRVTCSLDLLPGYLAEEVENKLKDRWKTLKNRTAEEMLIGLQNHKLNYILLKESGINPVEPAKEAYNSENLSRLAGMYKSLKCQVIKLNPFSNAQVCAGGIDTDEIDENTMESKIIPGLFFAGEIVDVDGTCGGYNLQWAWSSGYAAGLYAAK